MDKQQLEPPNVELVAALRHPLRIQLLALALEQREISPGRASKRVGVALSNVTYHVRYLEQKGALLQVDEIPHSGSVINVFVPTEIVEHTPWVLAVLGRSVD